MKTLSPVDLVLVVLAAGAFALASGPWVSGRINLTAIGLFLLTLTFLI